MKYYPILFSSSMVKANLEDRKTKTRRIVTGQALKWLEPDMFTPEYVASPENNLCPYGKVGDVLWVRETWKPGAWDDEECKVAFDYKASPEILRTPWCYFENVSKFEELHMKWMDELLKVPGLHPSEVDGDEERIYYNWDPGQSPLKWKPSIFMPKEACRIFLRIKSIKIERLQDISEHDTISEGVYMRITSTPPYEQKYQIHGWPNLFNTAKQAFKALWISINDSDSWDKNPWVWVIEYEKIDKPESFNR
jgi:hypothetical protein